MGYWGKAGRHALTPGLMPCIHGDTLRRNHRSPFSPPQSPMNNSVCHHSHAWEMCCAVAPSGVTLGNDRCSYGAVAPPCVKGKHQLLVLNGCPFELAHDTWSNLTHSTLPILAEAHVSAAITTRLHTQSSVWESQSEETIFFSSLKTYHILEIANQNAEICR